MWSAKVRACVVLACCLTGVAALPASWDAPVSREKPGDFPALPTPLRATYRIGWSGLTAARATVAVTKRGGQYDFAADTTTVGAARVLFPLDATIRSTTDASTLRPVRVEQSERRRDRVIEERVRFNGEGAERIKEVRPHKGPAKDPEVKTFQSDALHDFFSCFLALRSQRLAAGQTRTLAVMSPSVPYLITLTHRGTERLRIGGKDVEALRFSVDALSKVSDGEAKPQKKFRKATVWVSNDDRREIVRAESQVFIGSVFLEKE
ncbi:MAG: DUF3108 domain-containing protein [Verrucomicrobia bacterium]|nr:DUF3108 domain-containing protein [Verrucomicrobiota bacterium]